MANNSVPAVARFGPGLVVLGAALWGTDALMRLPLATTLPAETVVAGEHIVLVALTLVWLPGAVRAVLAAGWAAVLAALVIGIGSSAVATILFTQAFTYGDPVTPLLLQKLQPVIAIAGAMLVLHERPRRIYLWFFVAAFVSAWLLAFPSPFSVGASRWQPAALATGAAALWAAGTVLGRYLSRSLRPVQVTSLRFAGGLVGAVGAAAVAGHPVVAPSEDWFGIVLLALVPGLIALLIYYRGLQTTPASVATLCEMAFPATAAFVGVAVLHSALSLSQWVGAAALAAVVIVLGRSGSADDRVDSDDLATRPLVRVRDG